jgi:hypothetical protein
VCRGDADDILSRPAPEPSRSVPARAKLPAVQQQPLREDFAANRLQVQQTGNNRCN